jgi:hypothetical protein
LGLLGAPFVFAMNAVGFLYVLSAIPSPKLHSGANLSTVIMLVAIQRVSRTADLRNVLVRNAVFSFFIAVVPALTPVLILKELHLNGSALGSVLSLERSW